MTSVGEEEPGITDPDAAAGNRITFVCLFNGESVGGALGLCSLDVVILSSRP